MTLGVAGRARGRFVVVILWLSVVASACRLDMLDHQYLYFPSPWEPRDWKAVSGLPLEDVWITTPDGVRIFGWYVEPPAHRAVVLWYHGNAGNVTHRLDNLAELYRRGLAALIIDYRGYGRSEGRPSEEGLYADGLAAYDYLKDVRSVQPSRLVLFGRSLGAAVAGEVARHRQAAGLILESPFPSVEAVARTLYAGLPAHLLLHARFDLAARLKEVRIPVLVLHGDHDTIIPFALGQQVYAAANQPKRFFHIPGADHNDTYLVGGEGYFQELLHFIGRVTQADASSI